MNLLITLATYLLAGAVIAVCIHRYRRLVRQLAATQREAVRLRRHMERLAMPLQQAQPEMFAHVTARSDMEWQQATSRLGDNELPVLFPLETAYLPLDPLQRAS